MSDSSTVLTNGAKLVGEALLPGASLLMDGKFVDGAAHMVVGLGARAMLGPIGALLVAADSFSKSVTDRNLWGHIPQRLVPADTSSGQNTVTLAPGTSTAKV